MFAVILLNHKKMSPAEAAGINLLFITLILPSFQLKGALVRYIWYNLQPMTISYALYML